MSAVREFHQLTTELIDLLQMKTDRDEKILQVEALLEQREQAMVRIVPPYSDDEKALGKSLIDLNRQLTGLLSREKLLIQKDMKDLSNKKESNLKYTNPYENVSVDGMFYDKRK
ncbi:flagellar protein FliT [Mesobacillus harenae]|uniref:flagellar protein FliT n=1 Tax=Mesobacillus harenae TaxID=2213203 RepID=UPI001580394C|nr:flagellar protein FliT [Mesobacillus harenae]